MQAVILSIWILQGLLMFFDEFKYHHQRGLKLWERVGHPIDSFFFLLPFLYTQFFSNVYIFIGLSIFSCLIITKDEFVHNEECLAGEQWLHSILFIVHPVSLFLLFLAWENSLNSLIQIQSLIIFIFMLYQIIYWNLFRGQDNEA
jgi:hypothetical protein